MILPIGHLVGTDDAGRGHTVRVGSRARTLVATDDVRLWLLAHGLPGGPGPMTRSRLLDMAERAGVTDAAARCDRLRSAGLLVEVDGPVDTDFARSYRLVPLMNGVDRPAEDPDRRALAIVGEPALTLDEWTHTVWCWAPLAASLWELSVRFAEFATEDAGTDPDAALVAGPEEVLGDVLAAVETLLARNAAHLDRCAA